MATRRGFGREGPFLASADTDEHQVQNRLAHYTNAGILDAGFGANLAGLMLVKAA